MNELLLKEMLESVRGYVARHIAPINGRIEEIEKYLPMKGEKGDPGEIGPSGKDGRDVDVAIVRQLIAEKVTEALAHLRQPVDGRDGRAGKDGVDGKDGRDGKGVDAEVVRAIVASEVVFAVEQIQVPKDGKDGLPGAPGKDGRDGRDGKDGRDGNDGIDGAAGRDAAEIEIVAIDVGRSYQRGSFAQYRGGLIRAFRRTDPITNAGLEACGWNVVVQGILEEREEVLDEGRRIKRTTIYTDGREMVREFKTACILYRGVWREGTFERGDTVTWGGSSWHCEETTTDKPGDSRAWRLMVKEGRPGRDYKAPEPASDTVVRVGK